jgi:hypothetical protein
MSGLTDALAWINKWPFLGDAAKKRDLVVEAARLVDNPNIEAAAEARYETEREHVQNDWPSWADLGDFGRRTQVEFIKSAIAAALTPGDK